MDFARAEIGKACELMGRMEREGVMPNVVTLNTLVSGMCRDGKVSSAVDFFRQNSWVGAKGNAVTLH